MKTNQTQHVNSSRRQNTTTNTTTLPAIAEWALPVYKNCLAEHNNTSKFIHEKTTAHQIILNHIIENTFPSWFKRTTYKPAPNLKFMSDKLDWDLFNLNHDKEVLKNISIQYEHEIELATQHNKLETYLVNLKKQLEETGNSIFADPDPLMENGISIPVDIKNIVEQDISFTLAEFKKAFIERKYRQRMKALEEKRKKELESEKTLNRADNMDTTNNEIELMINRLIDLKLKKKDLSKNGKTLPKLKPARPAAPTNSKASRNVKGKQQKPKTNGQLSAKKKKPIKDEKEKPKHKYSNKKNSNYLPLNY